MPEFDSDMRFDSQPQPTEPFDGILTDDQDLLMEQILENINTTPIGQVLKKIAMLPEVRKEKILDIRNRITDGKYDPNDRLDLALDKVLEELTA
ncbi:MAG: flagellar biosynthesis anti-sigma factor FlgM [Planctomycetota bacterium]|jgi:hypothetical protein